MNKTSIGYCNLAEAVAVHCDVDGCDEIDRCHAWNKFTGERCDLDRLFPSMYCDAHQDETS